MIGPGLATVTEASTQAAKAHHASTASATIPTASSMAGGTVLRMPALVIFSLVSGLAALGCLVALVRNRQVRISTVLYCSFAGVLMVFGVIAGASIGIPFLVVGLALAVVAPWRKHPDVVWPAIIAVLGTAAGYFATAALPHRPSLVVAFFVGLIAGVVFAALTRHYLVHRHQTPLLSK